MAQEATAGVPPLTLKIRGSVAGSRRRWAERIRVPLTGRLGVEVDGAVADTAALRPLGSLALAFLVTERSRPVTREEALATVQAGLGSTAFERARAGGAAMSLNEVQEFAGAHVP